MISSPLEEYIVGSNDITAPISPVIVFPEIVTSSPLIFVPSALTER